jgi:hypothetical protein
MNALQSHTVAVTAALLMSSAAVAQHTAVPDPVALVGNKSQGTMSADVFKMQIGPSASVKGFELKVHFQVISFLFSVAPKHGALIGPYSVHNPSGTRFSDDKRIVDAIKMLKPGDKVVIENIKAIGPDSRTRLLNPVILLMN